VAFELFPGLELSSTLTALHGALLLLTHVSSFLTVRRSRPSPEAGVAARPDLVTTGRPSIALPRCAPARRPCPPRDQR
jgi:hypothetical protein